MPPLSGFSGLVFTSANGVRFFAEQYLDRTLPVWCVGLVTATAAKQAGFKTDYKSSGNVVTLAAFIMSTVLLPTKPLLHSTNDAAKDDFIHEMKMHGCKVRFAPLYRATPVTELNEDVISAMRSYKDCVTLVHSAMGAEAFHTLTEGLTSQCNQSNRTLVSFNKSTGS